MLSMAFIAGLVRVALFVAGAAHGLYHKRIVQSCAFIVTLIPSVVFLFANAGLSVPNGSFDLAVLLATPAAALLFGMTLSTGTGRCEGWRLW